MLGWLDRFFSAAAGTIGGAVSNAIHWAIHAAMAVVLSVFGLVTGAWSVLVDAYHLFLSGLDRFTAEVIRFASYVVHDLIPRVVRWAERELAKLSAALAAVYRDLIRAVNDLILRIAAAVRSVTAWVIREVYDPLRKYADLIWADLLKWGFYAWSVLTHLAAFADTFLMYLVRALEKQAWAVAKQLGTFTLAILHTQLKTIISVIEDILTAVI
jgi:phenylpyruvate tautomerase PptA (4-oxalocrotonate tautomerase family)